MGKSTPAAPKAPDPVVVANAQTQGNIDTANAQANLNRVNQVTPWGSQTYTQGADNGDGTRQWTSTVSLDPAQQRLLDSSNATSQSMADLGQAQIGRVQDAVNNPINTSGMQQVRNTPPQSAVDMSGIPQMQTGAAYGQIQNQMNGAGRQQSQVASGGQIQGQMADSGQIQGSVTAGGPIRTSINSAGNIQSGINKTGTEDYTRGVSGGELQRQVDMANVPGMVGGDALRGTMQDSQKAAYNMQSQYLDTSYQQRERDMENKLIQQGVLQGSDAWNREMQNLGQQRTFDYNNAFNNSFDKGMSAQGQLYNQGLASNQNAYGQALNNGQFANAAQAQSFGQNMQNAQLNNSVSSQLSDQRMQQMLAGNAAQSQQYTQNANDAAFNNLGQQQQFGQGVTQGNFANDAQAQQFAQGGASMDRANAAQAQQFGQNLAQGNFANNAQSTQFGQNLAGMQANNAAQAQGFGQAQSNAAMNNQVSSNLYSQGLAGAQLNNQAGAQQFANDSAMRSNQLNEAYQAQQNPINILNALRSGSQVTAPQFGNAPGSNVAPTDIAGLYNQQYQAGLAQYNGEIATNNSNQQGLVGLAAAAAAAY